jgi:hypothetical protein
MLQISSGIARLAISADDSAHFGVCCGRDEQVVATLGIEAADIRYTLLK